jgi:hypothetical protein
VKQSGLLEIFPEIDADSDKMGIFSQVLGAKGLDEPSVYQLRAMDRVEIYRPLIADPKEVRRRRAEDAAKASASVSGKAAEEPAEKSG